MPHCLSEFILVGGIYLLSLLGVVFVCGCIFGWCAESCVLRVLELLLNQHLLLLGYLHMSGVAHEGIRLNIFLLALKLYLGVYTPRYH